MGRIFVVELDGRSYRCKYCGTHLALPVDLVSRSFHCHSGKAYLFNNVVNITIGALEEKMMLSGMHTVADIFCCCCGQIIGWKYVLPTPTPHTHTHEAAHEKSQKYRVGKFVLESGRIVDEVDLSTEGFIDTHSDLQSERLRKEDPNGKIFF
ncbi:protein yippee-like At5g53940 isoform X4 [Hevea brasiliensis]|uniref:protein yippee-like At5g53940 isoform X4 n=1 Tax=Hevea brasiliensis TaxID=3981 RepID=UPI0025FE66F4|nr:protein yippee-like At5g53940 isoform X4 [Hevea brasiliensis]